MHVFFNYQKIKMFLDLYLIRYYNNILLKPWLFNLGIF